MGVAVYGDSSGLAEAVCFLTASGASHTIAASAFHSSVEGINIREIGRLEWKAATLFALLHKTYTLVSRRRLLRNLLCEFLPVTLGGGIVEGVWYAARDILWWDERANFPK